MKKKIFYSFLTCLFAGSVTAQNVGIGETNFTPSPSAILEVRSTNKGILIPRVALTQSTSASPIVNPSVSLMVYNTATINDVTPGFYFWDGNQWVKFSTGGSGLSLGCSNNNYVTKVGSSSTLNCSQILDNGTNVMIGTTTSTHKFHVEGNLSTGNAIGYFRNNQSSDAIGVFGYSSPADYYGIGGRFVGGWRAVVAEVNPTGSFTYTALRANVYGGSGTNYGLYADVSGTGGNKYGVFASITQSSPTNSTYAIYGLNSSAVGSLGMIGSSGTQFGVYGEVSSTSGIAVYASNFNQSGTGLVANGNNSSSYWILTDGSGLAATGYQTDPAKTGIAIYGKGAHGSNHPACGGYFEGGTTTPSYVYVGFRNSSGTNFKANGNGTVSTIVKNENNELVNMFCPEAPEVLFFDFGESQLQNGRTYVKLDPIFARNIHVDDKHPLRVFIQIYDDEDCQGVVVKNRSKDGFEVVERNNGKSNAKFTWYVIANRADEKDDQGNILSRYQDLRFSPAPGPQHSTQNPNVLLERPPREEKK